jgi:hypothetical protein
LNGRRIVGGNAEYLGNGRPLKAGDVIGVGVGPKTKVYFTLNGELLLAPENKLAGPRHLGVSADGNATLRVNAGQRPFLYKPSKNSETVEKL